MSTLAKMRERIADELARDDLTSQIAYAISDAIEAYRDERWVFNESRSITFNTISGQSNYGFSDVPDLSRLKKIDYVTAMVGGVPLQITPIAPIDLEDIATTQGEPWNYVWYGNSLNFYPTPGGAYSIRVAGLFTAAAPASDVEAGNPWMTTCERLIRSRAKYELALHVIKDSDLATTMAEAVREAHEQMTSQTNQLTQSGNGRVRGMAF